MSKVSPQENTPSPMSKSKGKTKESIGSLVKKPSATPKKSKRKEKVHEPSKELPMNVDLHFFEESNDKNDCLIVPFNGFTRGKGGKRAPKCLKMDKISRAQKKEVN